MKNIIKISALLILLSFSNTYAQDHHFSQYDATLQYLNPAMAGMSWDGDYQWRANTSYRSQWGSIASRPFTNQLLGFDMPVDKKFGAGGYICNNTAGSGNLNTLSFMLGGSYEVTIDPSNVHNLYTGLQIGLIHRNVKTSDLLFDSQYNYESGIYDANIGSGEPLGDKSIVRFDANLGFYYRYNDKQVKYKPFAGLSLFHCLMPNESLSGLKSRMPLRWVFMGGTDYQINNIFSVTPSFLIMKAAKASDLVMGLMGGYKIKDTDYRVLSGFSYRNKDALIIHMGVNHKRSYYRISYDFNMSYLKSYTNMKGGLEFSVIYLFEGSQEVNRTII